MHFYFLASGSLLCLHIASPWKHRLVTSDVSAPSYLWHAANVSSRWAPDWLSSNDWLAISIHSLSDQGTRDCYTSAYWQIHFRRSARLLVVLVVSAEEEVMPILV